MSKEGFYLVGHIKVGYSNLKGTQKCIKAGTVAIANSNYVKVAIMYT